MDKPTTRRCFLQSSIAGLTVLISGCSEAKDQIPSDNSESADDFDSSQQTDSTSTEEETVSTTTDHQNWKTFQANNRRQGYISALGPSSKERMWQRDLSSNILLSPVIVNDRIFYATDDKTIQARSREAGELLWEREVDDRIIGGVSVSSDALIYATQSRIEAVDFSAGKPMWAFSVEATPTTGPVPTTHEILIGANDGRIYAYTPSGDLEWRSVPLRVDHLFPLAADGTNVYITSERGIFVHDLDDGNRRWSVTDITPGNAATITDQLAIIGGVGGDVYGISKNGEQKWNYPGTGPITTSPAVRPDEVYITQSKHLKKLRLSSGDEEWAIELPNSNTSSPITTTEAVYIGSGDSMLAIDPTGGSIMWEQSIPGSGDFTPACTSQTLTCPGHKTLHTIGPEK